MHKDSSAARADRTVTRAAGSYTRVDSPRRGGRPALSQWFADMGMGGPRRYVLPGGTPRSPIAMYSSWPADRIYLRTVRRAVTVLMSTATRETRLRWYREGSAAPRH